MPINAGLIRGHLLCAGEEYPLSALHPVSTLLQLHDSHTGQDYLSDCDLFGSKEVFQEALDALSSAGLVKTEFVPVSSDELRSATVYKTHPVSITQ
jgi:hypothetical protein